MNLPKIIYVFIDKDDDGEYLIAHETINEISPINVMLIGIYELKEMYLMGKENKDDKK